MAEPLCGLKNLKHLISGPLQRKLPSPFRALEPNKWQKIFFFFWPHCVMCRILVPQPEIEPAPFVVKFGFLTIGPPGESHHRTPLNCHHALESESGSCLAMSDSLQPCGL